MTSAVFEACRRLTQPPSIPRAAVTAFAALALAGCAALSPPAGTRNLGDEAMLSGRLSVKVGGTAPKSVTAVFDLKGNAAAGSLDLSTPLGSMLAQARWTPGHVTLVTPRGESAYPDLDSLTRDVLGESVPVAAMFDWLRARPWAGAPSRALPTVAEAKGFEQLGWTVDLARFDTGFVDAQRAVAPPVSVRVRLD